MKTFFILLLSIIIFVQVFAQSKLDFSSVILKTEQFPNLTNNAKKLAIERNLPVSIFISDEVFAYPVIVENDVILFWVVKDFAHPLNGGYLATFNEIESKYDLNKARIRYYGDKITNSADNQHPKLAFGDSLYLIPESTNDRVMAFDAGTGDLIDADFIPVQGVFSTPIEALYHNKRVSFVVSDQLLDVVQEFDTAGVFLGTFAPKGGQATDTLDNVRGIAFHPNGNLLVSTAGGANSDAIVEFDSSQNFVRNFITPNTAIMDGPFDILIRANDVLIPANSSSGVHRYDFSGNYLDNFASGISFPEQASELKTGEVAVTNFSTPNSGIQIYPATGGTFTQLLTGITGNRGVAELGNGNLITTNGAGVHEIDRTTGNLVRTIIAGSARFISLYVINEASSFPTFNVLPDNIDFGIVQKDSSKTDTIIVYNSGNANLEITSVVSDNVDFVVAPDTGMIAINDSMIFEVTFSAGLDSGNQNGNIIFNHNAQTSPDTVTVMANVVTGLNKLENINPQTFFLSQNFPNPFNPITYIKFSLPISENVLLKIFNINGQEIATLIKKRLSAGKYNLRYDASQLPSGVYIYAIRAGDFQKSNKMILIK